MVFIINAQKTHKTQNGKASLAETFFQKLFGKRRAARIDVPGAETGSGPGPGPKNPPKPGFWGNGVYSVLYH